MDEFEISEPVIPAWVLNSPDPVPPFQGPLRVRHVNVNTGGKYGTYIRQWKVMDKHDRVLMVCEGRAQQGLAEFLKLVCYAKLRQYIHDD